MPDSNLLDPVVLCTTLFAKREGAALKLTICSDRWRRKWRRQDTNALSPQDTRH
jgi:hypothetical protein